MNLIKRLIVQPPLLYRLMFPEAVWRIQVVGRKVAYLTFDDGPVPEATPKILEILDHYNVKATFFMVGDNARRYPELYKAVRDAGHAIGNHTMHHVRGRKTSFRRYIRDILEAHELLKVAMFRPPHGLLSFRQAHTLQKHLNMIMYDVVTRDYARNITPEEVVNNVKRFARSGSIIVFHDSEKSAKNTIAALPAAIEWLLKNGFELRAITPPA
ncbi:MAG: polysaccharide deacetylase family protein [Muribaculaceae bacterium]|nr:polysaccharide deacetylase family protein [Muribaculaceae bacterium]